MPFQVVRPQSQLLLNWDQQNTYRTTEMRLNGNGKQAATATLIVLIINLTMTVLIGILMFDMELVRQTALRRIAKG